VAGRRRIHRVRVELSKPNTFDDREMRRLQFCALFETQYAHIAFNVRGERKLLETSSG
jgi:hypothetical protein